MGDVELWTMFLKLYQLVFISDRRRLYDLNEDPKPELLNGKTTKGYSTRLIQYFH